MTLKEIKEKLNTAHSPVARSLHQGFGFKVLVIGFHKGMILKEHKATVKSKLTVLEGIILYKEGEKELVLEQYDELVIPLEVLHSLKAITDSLCLLTQGD